MSNKAIFLDRDDTLIYDPGYINDPGHVRLLDGVADALIELKSMDYKLVVVSNQSAVARGMVTEKVLDKIHERLRKLLAEKGAFLDKIYYCPYHPDGSVEKYSKESDLRKPNHGMLVRASEEIGISLEDSWMIGDTNRDIEAGLRAGCKTILLDSPLRKRTFEPDSVEPDYTAVNMKEAVNIIKKYNRSGGQRKISTQSIPKGQTKLNSSDRQSQDATMPIQNTESHPHHGKTEQLLGHILEQLKRTQRADMFGDFSIMRLLAGVVQVFVLFCLLISIWFLMSPNEKGSAIFVSLGFAIVLQLMALTFFMMQGRK